MKMSVPIALVSGTLGCWGGPCGRPRAGSSPAPTFLQAAALTLISAAALAATQETVVVMPFTNLSGVERAPSEISAAFVKRIAAKGYAVVPSEYLEIFLTATRVRYLDSLSRELREKALAQLSASAIVFGTVYDFAEGDNAIVGVSARMLRADGSVAWAGVAGMSSEDTEGAFGLHRTNATAVLAEKAVERLVRDFPQPGTAVRLASARAKPLGASSPVTFRSAALEAGREHRICLLPFENRTQARLAGRVVAELLAQRLGASGTFEVVEPADFREALVTAGIRGLRSGDPAEMAKLSKALGTTLYLRGTIYAFKDASTKNASVAPELELDLALVDTASGRIVWTSRLARTGRDYEGLFQLGAITNIVTLTDQAAAEMVRAAEKATPPAPKQVVRQGAS